jgi:flagellar motility protein MotE (MotC chaperone)
MKSSILIVLAVGFAGFGALEVAALNPADAMMPKTKTETAALAPAAELPARPSSAKAGACLTPALVAAFEPRHKALDAREAKLDLRQAELENLESTIQSRLGDMEKTRDELAAMTAQIDVVAGEDISHLVQMYSTMKPKNAAAIFDRMDPAFAAGFLREIDSARAGVIMAEMGEEQSYRISLLIANRHAEWRNKG